MEQEICRAAGNLAGEPTRQITVWSCVTMVVIIVAVALVAFIALARTAEVYWGDPVAQRDALKRASNRLAISDAGVSNLDTHGTAVGANRSDRGCPGARSVHGVCYREQVRSQNLGSSASVFSNVSADGSQGAEVMCVSVPLTGEQGELLVTMV